MNFLQLPQELRLLIYSEPLVKPDPIKFIGYRAISDPDFIFGDDKAPDFPLPLRSSESGFYPVLLQVNKRIYSEAIPILYSRNTLQFPGFHFIEYWNEIYINYINICPFLRQIMPETAALIHHIRVIFPSINSIWSPMAHVTEIELEEERLDLILGLCTGLTTLQLDIEDSHLLSDIIFRRRLYGVFPMEIEDLIAETLKLLDTRFKAIPSLEAIIANFLIDNKVDEDKIHDDEQELMKKMQEYGWVLRITKLPERTREILMELA